MKHPSKKTLTSYGLGELDSSANKEIEQHLKECDECTRVVSKITTDRESVRPKKQRGAETRNTLSAMDSTSTGKNSVAKDTGNSDAIFGSTRIIPTDSQYFPNYDVIRKLGAGGMGDVYLARNTLMNRLEALKVIKGAMLGNQGAADRFLREIQSAAKLNHPNVVSAYNAFQSGDQLVFCMEYVEGKNLDELIDPERPFSVRKSCFFVIQAATGLQHAHENGLIHRDIKPGNLICFRQGKKWGLKLLDFGLAKIMSEEDNNIFQTQSGLALGTPLYIAPEQILGADKADIRSDIYSLGCTLYCLLSGHPPFTAGSKFEILQDHQSKTAESLHLVRPDIPRKLSDIVSRMMSKKADDRFQEPAEIVKALKEFLGTNTTEKSNVPEPSPGPASPVLKPSPSAELIKTDDLMSLPQIRSIRQERAEKHLFDKLHQDRWWVGGGLIAILLAGFFTAWACGILSIKTSHGTLILENVPDDADVFIDSEKITIVTAENESPLEISVPAGKHGVQVKKEGFQTFGQEVTLVQNDRIELSVKLEPNQIQKSISANNDPPPLSGNQPDRLPEETGFFSSHSSPENTNSSTETVTKFIQIDPFLLNSVWNGIGIPPNDQKRPVPLKLKVIERKGEYFKAMLHIGDSSLKEIQGKIASGVVEWSAEDVRTIRGRKQAASNSGIISHTEDGYKLLFTWRGKKGAVGTYALFLSSENEDPRGPFLTGSVWTGSKRSPIKPEKIVNYKLTVTERQGNTFQALFLAGPGIIREVKGQIFGNRLMWHAENVHAIKGKRGGDNFGIIYTTPAGATIHFDWFPEGDDRHIGSFDLKQAQQPSEAKGDVNKKQSSGNLRHNSFPSDAIEYDGHIYKSFHEILTWKKAKQRCEEIGGYLVEINSGKEQRMISDLCQTDQLKAVWLGASDDELEGSWKWNSGLPLYYNNWGKRQPNNKNEDEHYLMMLMDHGGTWSDQPNRSSQHQPGFICEWDPGLLSASYENPEKPHWGWHDMLGKADLSNSVFKGQWSHSNGGLKADARNASHAALNLPVTAESYEFETKFQIEQHKKFPGVILSLPIENSRAQFSLWAPDWLQMKHISNMDTLKKGKYNKVHQHLGFSHYLDGNKIEIKTGESCQLNIIVLRQGTNNRVSVLLNEKKVFEWEGKPSEIWEPEQDLNLWGNRNQQGIILACERHCVVDFHSARIREIQPHLLQEKDDGYAFTDFVSLFDGKTLDGWKGVTSAWYVQNGELINHPLSKQTLLVTEEEYQDFQLECEFKLNTGGQSGIFLRGRYELQLLDDPFYPDVSPDARCGAIWHRLAPSRYAYAGTDRWNKLSVQLQGKNVTVTLNGKTVINDKEIIGGATSEHAHNNNVGASGPIALQTALGQVRFRNIRLSKRIDHSDSLSSSRSNPQVEVSDLRLAHWVISNHGILQVRVGSSNILISSTKEIPVEPFRIVKIEIRNNPLESHALSYLQSASELTSLSLVQTGITDASLFYLQGLTKLQTINLNGNRITDDGLKFLDKLSALKELHLQGCQIQGDGLVCFANSLKLKLLDLNDTPMTNVGLQHISNIMNLNVLRLRNTKIDNVGLSSLRHLNKLEKIILSPNRIHSAAVVHLQRNLPDCEIVLQ